MASSWHRLCWALAFFVLAGRPAWSDTKPVEAGIIARYEPPGADYKIMRGDKLVPARVGGRVLEGDTVEVLTDHGKLELKLFDRPDSVQIVRNDGTFVVRTHRPIRSFWSPVLQWVSDELELMFREESGAVNANIRGHSDVSVTDLLMFRVPQRITAGERRLVMAWPSSVAGPVHVSITNMAGTIVARDTVAKNVWTSPNLALEPGRYRISLATAYDDVSGGVEAVPPFDMPRPPPELDEAVPADLRITARATWLASQANGAYLLESLQELAAITDRFPPAGILMRGIVEGSRPEPPPPAARDQPPGNAGEQSTK
jgi:hypothetical protein